jgi:endonuclease III
LAEKNESLKSRAQEIFKVFKKTYPDAKCSLTYQNPLQLLIATILSAQCTDVRVNIVTPFLFKKYTSASSFAKAELSELEQVIRSTGFYRNKAKNIKAACQMIVEKYNGKVPQTMDELLTLPGVARKTANVVLGNAFGIAVGVVVDTHVTRLTHRMGLTKEKTPEKIEQDLMKLLKQDQWVDFSHFLIFHGRKICTARKPECGLCPVEKYCPKLFS